MVLHFANVRTCHTPKQPARRLRCHFNDLGLGEGSPACHIFKLKNGSGRISMGRQQPSLCESLKFEGVRRRLQGMLPFHYNLLPPDSGLELPSSS
jgi:hypothetical protein